MKSSSSWVHPTLLALLEQKSLIILIDDGPLFCRNKMTVSAFVIWPLHPTQCERLNSRNGLPFESPGSPLFWNTFGFEDDERKDRLAAVSPKSIRLFSGGRLGFTLPAPAEQA